MKAPREAPPHHSLCPGLLSFVPGRTHQAPRTYLSPDCGLKTSGSNCRSPGSGFCLADTQTRSPMTRGYVSSCTKALQELGTHGDVEAHPRGLPGSRAMVGQEREWQLAPAAHPDFGASSVAPPLRSEDCRKIP